MGEYVVTLVKKPRYIIEENCTGCTTCVDYLPVVYPDRFNQELCAKQAFHIYLDQARPLLTYIGEGAT